MTPQEREDEKVVRDMKKLGRFVDSQLPYGWGFVVLAFPYGEGGRMNYVANAERSDVVRAMYEFIESSKAGWGEHIADPDPADEPLGRALQELARVKELLVRAADALEVRGTMADNELIAELREAGK